MLGKKVVSFKLYYRESLKDQWRRFQIREKMGPDFLGAQVRMASPSPDFYKSKSAWILRYFSSFGLVLIKELFGEN